MSTTLIVGGGSIGERHARCFLATERTAVSVCDLTDEVRHRLASTYPLRATFASMDEALQQSFDHVVVCTPANTHVTIALQALGQGAAVLLEKPLCVDISDAEQLLAAASSQHNAIVDVAYVSRHHPALTAMRDALQQQLWGRPLQIVLQSGQHFPFYRPAYRDIYYTRHETGGGAVQDALTHMLDAAQWLTSPIDRLLADAEHLSLPGVQVEDTVHVVTRHRGSGEGVGAVMGSFSLNQHQYVNETLLTVVCERGACRYDAVGCQWLSCSEPGAPWNVEQAWTLERDDLFVRQANHFLDVASGTAEARCSIEDAMRAVRVSVAILESDRAGEWVRI